MRKVKTAAFFLLVCMMLAGASCTEKESGLMKREEYIEHLAEKYKEYTEVEYGLDITKKTDVISICYSTWFTRILGKDTKNPNPPNITEILAGNQEWGGLYQFHYWAKPALGYYKSHDKDVIRTHMTQLADAGVDFIIIDNTNASAGWLETNDWELFITLPCEAILDTILEMRSEGLKTPYVVFWSGVKPEFGWTVVNETYEQFLSQEKWKDCFVYWEGKPFMITTDLAENAPEHLTLRKMWGLKAQPEEGVWSFLDIKNMPNPDADGYTEQMCVCTAAQETYMSLPTAHGRNHGIFLYTQWYNAFQNRPKVVTVTWWNEWAAQRFEENGNNLFVDNYTREYSRDIEPMEGGHGDQYYQWLKEYIRAYRALEECPVLVEPGYENEAAAAVEPAQQD